MSSTTAASFEDSMISSGSLAQIEASSFNITLDDLSSNRTAYKHDKQCTVCHSSFGMGLGIVHSKKRSCKFCYRGVCGKCSNHKVMHPETLDYERCCNTCFNNFQTVAVQAEANDEISKIKAEYGRVESRLELEQQGRAEEEKKVGELQKEASALKQQLIDKENDFKQTCELLKQEIEAQTKSNEELDERIAELERTLTVSKQELVQTQNELEATTSLLYTSNVKLSEFKAKLQEQEQENEELRNEVEEQPALPEAPTDSNSKKAKKLEELRTELDQTNKRVMELQKEQNTLATKLTEAQEVLKEKEAKLQLATSITAGLGEKKTANASQAELTKLRENIAALKLENKDLKREIDGLSGGTDSLTMTRKPINRENSLHFNQQNRPASCPNCDLF